MSENWVVQNLQNALTTWNEKQNEIWTLISQSPTEFKNGDIWNIVTNIHGALQAIALALLVVFFLVGVIKTCGSIAEVKRVEQAFKLFIRFAIAKVVVTHGLELLMAVFKIIQGTITSILNASGMGSATPLALPDQIIKSVEACGFFESIPLWAVTLIGGLLVTVLSFVMIQSVGKSFLKSYCAVCLEGAVIVLACIIFSAFSSGTYEIDATKTAVTQVWSYIGEVVFNMLVLVGTVKMSDRVVREMMGL